MQASHSSCHALGVAGAVAVEMGLGNVLNNWIVHDQHDQQQLRRMAASLKLSCFVHSFNTPLHNLSSVRQPPDHLKTLLKVLPDSPSLNIARCMLQDISNP